MAKLLWGFDATTGPYRFAMGYGASLMFGWTVLLLWAYARPIERQFVAALTVFVLYGLVATEIAAVLAGDMAVWRMVPTWCLQAALLSVFAAAYHYVRRSSAPYHSTAKKWHTLPPSTQRCQTAWL